MARARTLDHEKIVELYKSGISGGAIAKKLGCSSYGVYNALSMNGVSRRKDAKRSDTERHLGFKPTKKWMRELLGRHDCASAAAEEAGIPYPTFVNWMDRLGFPRKRWTGGPRGDSQRQDIPIKEAVKLSDGGMTYAELADRYKVSYGVVAKRLKEAGHNPPVRTRKYDDKIKGAPYQHKKILQERGVFACEICGEDRGFDFCHIVPRRDGGPTVVDNGLVLCPNHHRFFDRGLLRRSEKKKIRSRVDRARSLFQ